MSAFTWIGKTVVITGANRGIGYALAKLLSGMGAKIIGAVRTSSTELQALNLNGGIVIEGIDVIDDNVGRTLCAALSEFDTIDILINNSGILTREHISDESPNWDAMRKQFEVNSLGPFKVTHGLLSKLKEGSKVFVMSSLMGSISDNGSGGMYGYRMSKSAVNSVTKSMSVDLGKKGIIVMPIHPGYVDTDMTSMFPGGQKPEESAGKLIKVMEKATIANNGEFTSYKGHVDPW